MMLPRLRAEESMLEAERLAVGTGSLRPEKSKAILARWRRQVQADVKATPAPRELLAAAGIGVREVPRKGSRG
jgi:hypothetical protein